MNSTTSVSFSTNVTEILLKEKFVVEFYVFPVIFTIGTICNILTFIVMRRKRMRHQSTYFYMAVLAIADEMVLIVGCLNFWVYLYTSKMLLLASAFLCKIVCVALYATLHFSVWMVVTMTIERFIAVTYPLQASSWCTVKRAKIATIGIALFIFCINFHFLFTHTLVTDEEGHPGCQSSNSAFNFFLDKIWTFIDASVYSLIPLSLLFIFNILIVHNLIKASKKIENMKNNASQKNKSLVYQSINQNASRRLFCCCHALNDLFSKQVNQNSSVTNQSSNNKKYDMIIEKRNPTTGAKLCQSSPCSIKSSSKLTENGKNNQTKEKPAQSLANNQHASSNSNSNRRLTIMLLVISITFLTTSLPIVTLQQIQSHYRLPESRTIDLIKGVFLVLQYLNHSINFFLYAVTGKSFRKEFFSLFDACLCNKKRKSQNVTQAKLLNSISTTSNQNKNVLLSKKDLHLDAGGTYFYKSNLLSNNPKIMNSPTTESFIEIKPFLLTNNKNEEDSRKGKNENYSSANSNLSLSQSCIRYDNCSIIDNSENLANENNTRDNYETNF